jgi:hypothetical protein
LSLPTTTTKSPGPDGFTTGFYQIFALGVLFFTFGSTGIETLGFVPARQGFTA